MNQTSTQKIDCVPSGSKSCEAFEDGDYILHLGTTKRYPKMSQTDYTFGQIVNATANRLGELRKITAVHKLAQSQQV